MVEPHPAISGVSDAGAMAGCHAPIMSSKHTSRIDSEARGRRAKVCQLACGPSTNCYWSGVPPTSGGAVPFFVRKTVLIAEVEKPREPVMPAVSGTAVA